MISVLSCQPQICFTGNASCCSVDQPHGAGAEVAADYGKPVITVCRFCMYALQELFSPFGPISRVYIAYDRDTGENRGFAFVNFVYRYALRLSLHVE